jgi:hypothetical protein
MVYPLNEFYTYILKTLGTSISLATMDNDDYHHLPIVTHTHSVISMTHAVVPTFTSSRTVIVARDMRFESLWSGQTTASAIAHVLYVFEKPARFGVLRRRKVKCRRSLYTPTVR